MHHDHNHIRIHLCFLALILLSVHPMPAFSASPPRLAEAKAIAEQHLRSLENYAPGDLISRGDVEPIFNELLSRGLPVNDIAEELYDEFIPDNSFLLKLLRTEDGRKFMRQVNRFPQAYDRLERLSWVPAGQEILRELVASPDGASLFKAMLEPAGLEATARLLESDPRGKNYSLPTGHVHTAAQFLKRLEKKFPGAKKAK
jgi:hypothetical protein